MNPTHDPTPFRAHASVFEFDDARAFLKHCLGRPAQGESRGRNGSTKQLATALRCHATYISQIVNGRAHFNNEQAVAFCATFGLDDAESEYFLHLVNRDRAGTTEARKHFDRILKRQRDARDAVQARIKITNSLTTEQKLAYYETWIPQAVHILCQTTGVRTAENVARALDLRLEKARKTLKRLEEMGLIARKGVGYESVVDSLHLEPDSPLRAKLLANWRFKSIEDQSRGIDSRAIHYSAVMSLSADAIERLRALILDHLEETRAVVLDSSSEKVSVFNLDFYNLV